MFARKWVSLIKELLTRNLTREVWERGKHGTKHTNSQSRHATQCRCVVGSGSEDFVLFVVKMRD